MLDLAVAVRRERPGRSLAAGRDSSAGRKAHPVPIPDFQISIKPLNPGCVVAVTGEVDLAVAGEMEAELMRAVAIDGERAVLDLTDCEFLDSSGLEAILHAAGLVADLGGRLRVICPDGQVGRVIELTGSDRLIKRHIDRAGALASLPGY
jgi:anti-sigma B factor antagonist